MLTCVYYASCTIIQLHDFRSLLSSWEGAISLCMDDDLILIDDLFSSDESGFDIVVGEVFRSKSFTQSSGDVACSARAFAIMLICFDALFQVHPPHQTSCPSPLETGISFAARTRFRWTVIVGGRV